jgi:transposase-like protein
MSFEERRCAWESRLAAHQSSGLSVSSWCKQHSIALSTFSYWRKRLREHVSDGAPTPVERRQWLTMEVASRAGAPSLREIAADHRPSSEALILRVGRVSIDVTPGFDPDFLADVLTVLEARC